MITPANKLVRKLWQYCNVLRDDGLSYPDYVEQLTYLLFLKMAEERGNDLVSKEYGWGSFTGKDAPSLHKHYSRVLRHLGSQGGMLGMIFYDAKNKIRDPAKLRTLVLDLIGQTDWSGMSEDVKGDAYEGLLEKNAQDTKSGAGQYFTPRPLIDAIIKCVNPLPGEVICDPACGTGGFLLATHDYIRRQNPTLKPAQRRHLKRDAIRGVELVREVARLAAMNLMLHGVGDAAAGAELPICCEDSLATAPGKKVDVVLTNPPFGVKGSFVGGGEEYSKEPLRKDFWVRTANKQLNFLQHVYSMLKPGGRAGVVVPDNVLFESGGAEEIRRRLLTTGDVHTLLRLPTGIFYAHGVKANVLFFDVPAKRSDSAQDGKKLWVYDLRSDNRYSLKSRPITADDLADFVARYKPDDRSRRKPETAKAAFPRWKCFDTSWVLSQPECSLDIGWTREVVNNPVPAADRLRTLAARVASDLREALRQVELADDGLPQTLQ